MLDGQGRTIDYLRVSITDRCNLRCVYCMPAEGVEPVSHERILTFDEIERVVYVMAAECGLKKIKVTGGEPLARRGCPELIGRLKKVPGIRQVTLTTNAVTLKDHMAALHAAGIDAINISLDTLDPARFTAITRRDALNDVMEGIAEAQKYPVPLKINCVPISGDDEDIILLASIAKHNPIHVRFIEVMPIGLGKNYRLKTQAEIMAVLEKHYGDLTPDGGGYGNGPSVYYSIENFVGKIGFISAISHKFCDSCNRVRLTSEGFLKTCLQYDTGADLRTLLRNGASDEVLCETIKRAILEKPICHGFYEEKTGPEEQKVMGQIGG